MFSCWYYINLFDLKKLVCMSLMDEPEGITWLLALNSQRWSISLDNYIDLIDSKNTNSFKCCSSWFIRDLLLLRTSNWFKHVSKHTSVGVWNQNKTTDALIRFHCFRHIFLVKIHVYQSASLWLKFEKKIAKANRYRWPPL